MQNFLCLSNMSINRVSVFLVENLWNFQSQKSFLEFINFSIYCPEKSVYVYISILWEKRGNVWWRKGPDKNPWGDVLTAFTGSFFLLLFSKGQLISANFFLCSHQLPYAPDQDICTDNNWPLILYLFLTC